MQVEPVLAALRAQLAGQVSLGAADPQIEAAAAHVVETLEPALRAAVLDLAQQAAVEIDAQLPEHTVSVVLSGADVELRVGEQTPPSASVNEELDARLTLRLPPSLKHTIERFANTDGESVNSWVVEALSKRAHRTGGSQQRVTEEFDL